MKRREFITLVGGAGLASAVWPCTANAQTPPMRRIGLLTSQLANDPDGQSRVLALLEGLYALGWIEGRTLGIDHRPGVNTLELLKRHTEEIISLGPDLIVTGTSLAVRMLQDANSTIPIVFAGVADPVGAGLVASLARPGGNVTGFSAFEYEIGGKWLALLKEMAPRIERVAFIFNREGGPLVENFWNAFEASAPAFGIKPVALPLRSVSEVERSIDAFAREPNGGLLGAPEITITLHRELIMHLAARHRLPAIYPYRYFAVGGGLASYGIVVNDQWRRAASYVDRILKGEKPADLPVQTPVKFEFVLNLKTAKALGLDIPASVLARADEVIE
jgi:putative ABC transport system substrate-binding protein